MLTDMELAELMDTIDQEDKVQLAEMLARMTDEDIAYFKGYVKGYATAVVHLQMALRDDANVLGTSN